ncbi:MAG: glycosyltransferase family 2 protein, partial [Clostridia bacterium]|nr:glycosyltransferase family 2 protein [Clostridia bacterium]
SRNFGQQAAILCGFRVCTGDCAVELDCDLQDPVELIPKMIEKWKEGYDVVHGRRIARKGETFFKKATASYDYKKLAKVSSIDLPRNTGDFKRLDRKIVDIIINLPEHNKYLRGLESWVGFKQTFVDYERNERIAGETHYTMKKMINLAKAGLISNSFYPLSFSLKFGVFGGVLSVLGYIALIFLAAFGVINGPVWWLFPTITLLFSGLAVFNGLTNLYIEKIYDEVKNRPEYIIDDKINLEN